MADIKKIQVDGTDYLIDADKVDGKHASDFATASHTHSFSAITSRGEAYLSWGGKDFSGDYGPMDAALVDCLGPNRMAFINKYKNGDTTQPRLIAEYSRDDGDTWTDYGATIDSISNVFNGLGSSFIIGKNNTTYDSSTKKYADATHCRLRFRLLADGSGLYNSFSKFLVYVSTSGTGGNQGRILGRLQSNVESDTATYATLKDWTDVSGWSGWNVWNGVSFTWYGNSSSKQYQYGEIIFEFKCTSHTEANRIYSGLSVNQIRGYGGVGWSTPSNMARYGHMYSYDSNQNVTFPAKVTATSIAKSGGTASQFLKADGSVDTNTYLTTSGKAADADKLDGQDSTYYLNYNNLSNKPTIPAAVTESTVAGWGFTKNAGTITGIKMNGASKGSSGVVDLGTVITAHQDISGKENTSNKVTSWSSTTTDAHYPSEKLVKTALDGKQNTIDADHKLAASNVSGLATVATSGSYNDLTNKPTIPTDTNQKVKAGTVTFGNNDEVNIVAGSNVTVTGDATNKKITIAATDTTYESKTAASGGTAVSLVTTGEKYTWNNKGTYSKPSGGIPKTDLASAVQTSLGKADTALQSFTETDPTVPDWAKAASKPTYTASEVGARPSTWTPTKSDVGLGNVGNFKAVSTVASQGLTDTEKSNARANIGAGTSSFSGNYNDLTNKPTRIANADHADSADYATEAAEAGHAANAGQADEADHAAYAAQLDGTLAISGGGTGATTAAAARTNLGVAYGTTAGTVCQGNDSRLSDARTPTSHTHGNITNAGALQTTDITIANGDKLVVTDASNSNKVARTSIAFDAATTGQYLSKKGTFEAVPKANVQSDWNATSGDAQILNKPETIDISSALPDNIVYTDDLGNINGTGNIITTGDVFANTKNDQYTYGRLYNEGQLILSSGDGYEMSLNPGFSEGDGKLKIEHRGWSTTLRDNSTPADSDINVQLPAKSGTLITKDVGGSTTIAKGNDLWDYGWKFITLNGGTGSATFSADDGHEINISPSSSAGANRIAFGHYVNGCITNLEENANVSEQIDVTLPYSSGTLIKKDSNNTVIIGSGENWQDSLWTGIQLNGNDGSATFSEGDGTGEIRINPTSALSSISFDHPLNGYGTTLTENGGNIDNINVFLPSSDGTLARLEDLPPVPSITLNGTDTLDPYWYAPTSTGTSGYRLVSNGTGAPVWQQPTGYVSCSTAASTVAKTVTCTNFKLVTGAKITVKFTNSNSAASPTLNVSSTGAKTIYYKGKAAAANWSWAAGEIVTFVYDGTYYQMVSSNDNLNPTYTSGTTTAIFNASNTTATGTFTATASAGYKYVTWTFALMIPTAASATRYFNVHVYDSAGTILFGSNTTPSSTNYNLRSDPYTRTPQVCFSITVPADGSTYTVGCRASTSSTMTCYRLGYYYHN